MNTLIIDSNFLCHQARYTMPKLTTDKEAPTEITFGFLKRILHLAKEFDTNRFVFCWDSKRSVRKELFSDYKANRKKEKSEFEKKIDNAVYSQFTLLRKEVLPALGFSNNFVQAGYESDDLIASIVFDERNKCDNPIVVTSDEDLFQLLSHCSVYNPTKRLVLTEESFKTWWGISPQDWVQVKAIAGCKSDNVPGVRGVGEGRAIQYLLNTLNEKSGSFKNITEFLKTSEYERNIKLVSLPYKGTKSFKIDPAFISFDKKTFVELCLVFDFNSFLDDIETWERVFGRGNV
jgi:DNA polymerase I